MCRCYAVHGPIQPIGVVEFSLLPFLEKSDSRSISVLQRFRTSLIEALQAGRV